jgi:SAM-dependent methyltransferase
MVDWSAGYYERVGEQLLPAVALAIDRAALAPGDRVLDLGCGTGLAALEAAALGAQVTGVDPATRLIEEARAAAAARGLDVTFVVGEAAQLPFADASIDVVISTFGVVFAPDARAAANELARVTAPGGRIVLTAWIASGAVSDAREVRRGAFAAAGVRSGAVPFAWEDEAALAGLFEPLGFRVAVERAELAFSGSSAEWFVDTWFRDHPLWIADRVALESHGAMAEVRERTIAVVDAANEDPGALRVTSPYAVAMLKRR